LFPASVEDIEKALQVDRLNRNVPVDSSNWEMLEQLISLEARKNAMTAYTDDLYLGAQEAHQALWLVQKTPTDPLDLGNDLHLSKVRVGEWWDSGAQVGADEALTYFLSGTKRSIWRLCALCAKDLHGPWTQSLSGVARS
jgi:hypothetical protein